MCDRQHNTSRTYEHFNTSTLTKISFWANPRHVPRGAALPTFIPQNKRMSTWSGLWN